MAKAKQQTPLMKQYNGIKAKYPDALLLFRVGDFYETFGEDAVKTAKTLDIVLTKRANGSASHIELAGFPHHALDSYLPKLVRAGYRVAICDQLELPSKEKKIVKRGVTELVTPGVALNEQIIGSSANNFLMAVHTEKNKFGVALLDISTGEFFVHEGNQNATQKIIQNFNPKEIIFQKRKPFDFLPNQVSTFQLDDWAFQYEFAYEKMVRHFKTQSLKGFGIEDKKLSITAAGAVFAYLDETHHFDLLHINSIQLITHEDYVWLDAFTMRNLELIHSSNDQAVTLLDILDHTVTPMGTRLLQRWIALPLSQLKPIQQRQNAVQYFLNEEKLSQNLIEKLREIGDLERFCAKIVTGKISPKQLTQLTSSLVALQEISNLLNNYNAKKFKSEPISIEPLPQLLERLKTTLTEDPPHAIAKGNVIAEGISEELDRLRKIQTGGKEFLDEMLQRETKQTGIPSLKISFNNVFGYYLEVRNTHKDKVPESWVRKQTLVSSERYITEELKTYEQQILGAEEKILQLETQLFEGLLQSIVPDIAKLQATALAVSILDCLLNFSELAKKNQYVKPLVNESLKIEIEDGRHPVIEKQLPPDQPYIANSVYLDTTEQQIMMITGPNMSGKSALLRQTALIVLMAQMGSYVPAKHAALGITDKIFTRVGASDNLSLGESTFMVEMNETAQILNSVSERSLILLDEIGRGTSTYDGISIAWAIAEFLHTHKGKPKTLFATHYHELNEMAKSMERIKNYNVSIKETGDSILFLRKLKPGGSEHSFGIHVAQMAGVPQKVIRRANEILQRLEENHDSKHLSQKAKILSEENLQLSFFQLDDPILEAIRDEVEKTDINTLTPVEALMKLNEIKKMIGK